jgi:hypothetical protein
MRKFLLPLLAAALCATPASATVTTVNITGCGQAVPDKAIGVLQNDLSCPGGANPGDPPAVLMGKSSTLQMNSHKITGGGCAIAQGPVIPKSTRITVQGPGEIANSHDGICFGRGRLTVSGLNIHNVHEGVHGSDAPGSGCVVAATNVTLTSNETGIHGFSVIANSVTATGNSFAGIWTFNLNGDALTSNTNATGILAHGSVRLKDSSSVKNNTGMGIDSRTAALRDSTITGNNGQGVGIDIGTANRPGAKNVTCGRSWKRGLSTSLNWGICTND